MAMTVSERRILDKVKQAIQVSDPQLTSMFTIFSRLNRDEHMPAAERLRPGPPARHTAWLLCALATLVLLATIVMNTRPGAATCAPRPSVAWHQARTQTCAAAENPLVPGAR